MTKKLAIKLVVATAIMIIIFIAYSAYSIWTYSSNVEFVKTDAAIVLGAAAWDDEPSPVLRERINHAIWLYENHYVEKIIFTGGKGKDNMHAESEVARDYAIKNHVKPEHIVIETRSKITEENLKYAFEIAANEQMKTFTIVSDPLHMKRAMLIAERLGLDAYSSPTPSSVYKTMNSQVPFLMRELFYYIGYKVTSPFRSMN